MYGLEAINAANGWAMAIFGILIVMTGLSVLSTVIAQFPKIIALMERHGENREQKKKLLKAARVEEKPTVTSSEHSLTNIEQTASLYDPVVEDLGESFKLRDLYEACKENDFPHPHLTIATLRAAKILVPKGGGVFGWNR